MQLRLVRAKRLYIANERIRNHVNELDAVMTVFHDKSTPDEIVSNPFMDFYKSSAEMTQKFDTLSNAVMLRRTGELDELKEDLSQDFRNMQKTEVYQELTRVLDADDDDQDEAEKKKLKKHEYDLYSASKKLCQTFNENMPKVLRLADKQTVEGMVLGDAIYAKKKKS